MMINMQRFRLLCILLFHIQGAGMQVLLNPLEILVKEFFFFNKTSALQPANAIKTKFLANSFQRFLGTANLKNNSFLFTG